MKSIFGIPIQDHTHSQRTCQAHCTCGSGQDNLKWKSQASLKISYNCNIQLTCTCKKMYYWQMFAKYKSWNKKISCPERVIELPTLANPLDWIKSGAWFAPITITLCLDWALPAVWCTTWKSGLPIVICQKHCSTNTCTLNYLSSPIFMHYIACSLCKTLNVIW